METAQPVWTIPSPAEEAIRRESAYGEELSLVSLFPEQPLKEASADKGSHTAYVAVTGDRLYAFWKDKEGQPRGRRFSMPSRAPFSLDYSRFLNLLFSTCSIVRPLPRPGNKHRSFFMQRSFPTALIRQSPIPLWTKKSFPPSRGRLISSGATISPCSALFRTKSKSL